MERLRDFTHSGACGCGRWTPWRKCGQSRGKVIRSRRRGPPRTTEWWRWPSGCGTGIRRFGAADRGEADAGGRGDEAPDDGARSDCDVQPVDVRPVPCRQAAYPPAASHGGAAGELEVRMIERRGVFSWLGVAFCASIAAPRKSDAHAGGERYLPVGRLPKATASAMDRCWQERKSLYAEVSLDGKISDAIMKPRNATEIPAGYYRATWESGRPLFWCGKSNKFTWFQPISGGGFYILVEPK